MRLSVRIRQNERGRYIASCPSLPGCVSSGLTVQQAKENLEEAIRGYLASMSNFIPTDIERCVEYKV